VFYPDKFAAPVANDSEIFDYDNWVRDGWELKIGWQKLGTDARFPRAAPGADRSRAVGFRAAPATTSCSPARTSTRPCRFSLDFRIVDLGDHARGLGAPNVDNRSRESALRDYVR